MRILKSKISFILLIKHFLGKAILQSYSSELSINVSFNPLFQFLQAEFKEPKKIVVLIIINNITIYKIIHGIFFLSFIVLIITTIIPVKIENITTKSEKMTIL